MLKRWQITHAQAVAEYRYSPETGVVIGPRGREIGHIKLKYGAGSRRKVVVDRGDDGVIPITRLIWFLVHGEWPETIVDHINADPTDQRLANLRLATLRENNRNSAQRLGVSGYRNVTWKKEKKRWRVSFSFQKDGVKHRVHSSRTFKTPEEAATVADRMRAELHGPYASVRER